MRVSLNLDACEIVESEVLWVKGLCLKWISESKRKSKDKFIVQELVAKKEKRREKEESRRECQEQKKG